MTLRVTLALLTLLGAATSAPAQDRKGKKRGPDEAPAVGQPAPDFDLPRLVDGKPDESKRVKLSGLRGKPVVLIFGSYT